MKTYKLYQVTYVKGTVSPLDGKQTLNIRASSMQMAGSQSTYTDGSDILRVDLIAVDTGKLTRESARKQLKALQPKLSTRRMQGLPCNALLRHTLNPSTSVRVSAVSDHCVTFRLGGAY